MYRGRAGHMADGGLGSGWRIARIFGITVRIHASWIVIFFLLTYSLASEVLPLSDLAGGGPWWEGSDSLRRMAAYRQYHPGMSLQGVEDALGIERWPEWHYWLLAVIGTLGLFVCVLAHEIAHSIVAREAGIPVEGITLFLFGGVSRLKEEAQTPGVEFRVAAAGPLMSLAIGLACGVLYYGAGPSLPPQARALLYYFLFINLGLVVFNLLPGFPLDGGRLLRAILWKRYQSLTRATAAAAWWGKAIGAGFVAIGLVEFWVEFTVTRDLSLGPLWLVLIGLFLRNAAKASHQQVTLRASFAGLTVRDVIQQNVVAVSPEVTLEQLVDHYFYTYRFRSFPVLEADRLAGMIGLKDVQAVPRTEWAARTVRDAMHQVREENLVRPGDDLASVFRKMMEEDKGHLPVVEDGRLRGMVTRHDIMTLLQIRTDLGDAARTGRR